MEHYLGRSAVRGASVRIAALSVIALSVAACDSGSSGGSSDPDADRDGLVASTDCNDNDAAAWRTLNLFADTDSDGVGAGQAVPTCMGNSPPAGLSTSSTDCAAGDPTVHTLMSYAGRDVDGDNVLVASTGSVCGNGATLPATYFANAGNTTADCDDHNAAAWMLSNLHQDFDRDGVGHGPLLSVCAGNSIPVGFATSSTDCDDRNAAGWVLANLHEDFDRDGVGHGPLLSVCAGAGIPPGFANSSTDCAPLDTTEWRMVASYTDVDGDGVGSGAIMPLCVGSGPPPFGSSFLGFDPLDTLTDPDSTLVSDFDLGLSRLFIEAEADDDDVFP